MARNLLWLSPTETVTPISVSTLLWKRARVTAGVAPCTRSVPERSRNASSMESGSTAGVSASMASRTSRPTRAYFCMSGGITTAFGQAFSALNIGIAECTPKVRAT